MRQSEISWWSSPWTRWCSRKRQLVNSQRFTCWKNNYTLRKFFVCTNALDVNVFTQLAYCDVSCEAKRNLLEKMGFQEKATNFCMSQWVYAHVWFFFIHEAHQRRVRKVWRENVEKERVDRWTRLKKNPGHHLLDNTTHGKLKPFRHHHQLNRVCLKPPWSLSWNQWWMKLKWRQVKHLIMLQIQHRHQRRRCLHLFKPSLFLHLNHRRLQHLKYLILKRHLQQKDKRKKRMMEKTQKKRKKGTTRRVFLVIWSTCNMPYIHQHTHLSKLNVACQEGVRRSLTMQSTGTGPTQTIKGLAVRGPDGKLQRVTWFMVCLLHVLDIHTIYIYIHLFFILFQYYWTQHLPRSKNWPLSKLRRLNLCQVQLKWMRRTKPLI